MDFQRELLQKAQKKYTLSQRVCEAYLALPRHKFLHRFSPDSINWLRVTADNLDVIYTDSTLLLYDRLGHSSTISQPSFVLHMLDLADLQKGHRVFEVGTGSGWNAALMGNLVGQAGEVISYEIIPEMAREARDNISQFDLPQVKIIQGDAFQEIWEEAEFDRGIFTAGALDLPGILFDVIKEGGKLLFVLKTTQGDLLLAMIKQKDHFRVFQKMPCRFAGVSGQSLSAYHNDLSRLYQSSGTITIWPQGTIGLGPQVVVGRDMVFKIESDS